MTSISARAVTERVSVEARIRGAIWGRLVADAAALGSHWIYDLDEQRRQFPGGVQGFEAPAAGHYHAGKAPGDQTHYGDGALLLLDSVAHNGRFDVRSFGQAFVTRFRPGHYGGYIDHATRGTIENYDAFAAAHPAVSFDFQHGADDDHPATVTRAAAVVARHFSDADVLDLVLTLTRFAQDNSRAVSYARADAVLLLLLLAGQPLHSALDELVRQFSAVPAAEAAEVIWAVTRARADQGRDPVEATLAYGQSCPLPYTFPAALQILLRYEADFHGGVLAALRGGGDNAGRAAMVGGWLGAHLGAAAIPARWLRRLSASGRIGLAVDKIVADALGL